MKKIIGIIGSRHRTTKIDFDTVEKKFLEIYNDGDWICSGGCPTGGDQFAHALHVKYETPYLEFPARWNRYGKSAGYKRNGDIANASNVLIACVSIERIGGTEDTIKKFLKTNEESKLYIV